jgi:hypothetical protein
VVAISSKCSLKGLHFFERLTFQAAVFSELAAKKVPYLGCENYPDALQKTFKWSRTRAKRPEEYCFFGLRSP